MVLQETSANDERSMLKLARQLGEQGFFVFPCRPKTRPPYLDEDGKEHSRAIKKPWGVKWGKESTSDDAEIIYLWTTKNRSDAMPGIALAKSDYFVIDLDRHNRDEDGVANFSKLASEHACDISDWPSVTTPSGGVHIYFKQPDCVTIGNGEGKLPPGIDVRGCYGAGGYVIAPGSVGEAGAYSEFSRPITDAVEPPQWLIDILKPPLPERFAFQNIITPGKSGKGEQAWAAKALSNIAGELASTSKGSRNKKLNKSAFVMGTMVARGWISEHEVRSALVHAAEACGHDGDTDATIDSGLEAGLRNPHSDLPDNNLPRLAAKLKREISGTSKDDQETEDGRHQSPLQMMSSKEIPLGPQTDTAIPLSDIEDIDPVIAELNQKYAVVDYAGKVAVIYKKYNKRLRRFHWVLMTRADFKALYENQTVTTTRKVVTKDKKTGQETTKDESKVTQLGEYWLKHPQRRQYTNGVVFDPSESDVEAGQLNLWTGFGYEPIQKANGWSKFKHHIFHNICSGNKKHYRYLIRWLANAVQNPDQAGQVIIVLKGGKGNGKGTFAHAIRRLFGQHGSYVTNSKHLTGRFNGHLRDCILLFSDEAFFAGDKPGEATLKALATDDIIPIEDKGFAIEQFPNRLHIIMASNNEWVVPASLDERRYFVLEVGEDHVGDSTYWNELYAEMENGGYSAMLYDLLDMDLSDWDVREFPRTKALREQQLHSLDSKQSWLLDIADRGFVYKSEFGTHEMDKWHDFVTTELLHKSYLSHHKERGKTHPDSKMIIGTFLKKLGFKKSRPRDANIIGEFRDGNLGGKPWRKENQRGYRLGTRDEFEALLYRKLGIPVQASPSVAKTSKKKPMRWIKVTDRSATEAPSAVSMKGAAHEPDESLDWVLVDPAEAAAASLDN
jgi:hypothetical protein